MTKTLRALSIGIALAVSSAATLADDLHQIYQKALEKDPALRQAIASRDAAMEATGVSMAALLPQIALSAEFYSQSSNRDAREVDNQNATLSLSQSIYDRSNWVNLDRSDKVASQAETSYQAALQDLMLRVSTAYFDVLSAGDQLEFVQATKKAIARQLEQTKQRFAVGLTAITDVHEAQAEYDQSVADEIVALNDLENSYEGLREITGMYHKDLNVLNTKRFSPVQPEPKQSADWQNLATNQNLNLIISQLGVDIAMQDIELAQSGHWPTFSLFAQLNTSDNDYDDPSVAASASYSHYTDNVIGIQMDLPIYSGGATSASTRVARANYVEASEQLNETYRGVMRGVINAYNNVKASISAVKAFEQTVISRESSLQATEAGFEVGTRTIVDVLDSTRNLFDAKSQLSSARYNYILSVLQLKFAAGNLSEQDIVLINNGLTRPS
ncbi:outer membrane channel protein TolC [Neiella marina]|uniref:Outer membrane channel protein TolC n=1 Tax=Neiella holothuriorum TaxID=2870530 RepID=A0ABS7EBK7_9GAMM|nr:outer membrane channel protein TolC [Neiella holothuriorum]MBW8189707.1 outer membrane channel protein TolC [Neiella holothuriorum]